MGYGEAKKALADKFESFFGPFRERRAELERNPDEVMDVLRAGAARARSVIQPIVTAAREAVGLENSHE